MGNEKACRVCGTSKALSEFSPHATAADGHKAICKPCNRNYQKQFKSGARGLVYSRYWNMRDRVYGAHEKNRKCYASKGIEVCRSWMESFENFFSDMGPPPSAKHQLDRIDNSKGYSKENCRWATPSENRRNRDDYKRKHGLV